jgi:hypothetical protein
MEYVFNVIIKIKINMKLEFDKDTWFFFRDGDYIKKGKFLPGQWFEAVDLSNLKIFETEMLLESALEQLTSENPSLVVENLLPI